MPLLGSMSCGVFPVVTNTGFAYDVLAPDLIESLISTDAGPAEIVNLILSKYFSMSDRARYREIDGEFTFEKAAMKIFDHMY